MEERATETSGIVLPNGVILEQICDDAGEVYFAVMIGDQVSKVNEQNYGDMLYRPINNVMVSTGTVMFPSDVKRYDNEETLRQEVQDFIHRFCEVSEYFELMASYYVILTWVYERFSVLPYLSIIGEPGTGKSRFLQTVGTVCYKPMRVSGAISVASIFRMISEFHGTLILEEADLPSTSDEYTSIVKILNCGFEKGNPVIRQELVAQKYQSVAYDVFCPKIVARRKRFDDRALETRMITEKMTKMTRRDNIPLNLPSSFREEALALRNKLLTFRFKNYHRIEPDSVYALKGIEPRILQIVSPLLQIMGDNEAERERLLEWSRGYTQDLITERAASGEGDVVRALFDVESDGNELTVKNITERVNEQYDRESEKVSIRRVGRILTNLALTKRRVGRGYVIDETASRKTLELLRKQYGIE